MAKTSKAGKNKKGKIKDRREFKKKLRKTRNSFTSKAKNLHYHPRRKPRVPSDSFILNKYESMNNQYINSLPENEKNKIIEISEKNSTITPENEAKKLGEALFTKLISLKHEKKKGISEYPNLVFGARLTDNEFVDLVDKSIKYCNNTKEEAQLLVIKDNFQKKKDSIKSLFLKPRILKDIFENAILTILISDYDINVINTNFSLLLINDSSYDPLANIPFSHNDKAIDLNKDSIIQSACSNIPLLIFEENLKNFIHNYNLTRNSLKKEIKNYIKLHNFYFATMADDIQAFIIHTGDIFINIKYLREYFTKENKQYSMIIREKIILIIFHELNHGLLRQIDATNQSNFFKRSKSKIRNKYLIFKAISKPDTYHIPCDESGNFFDYLFYNQYYLDKIDQNIANFYFNIDKIKSKKEYTNQLADLLKNIDQSDNNVFKFKKNFSKMTQCAFSLARISGD